MGNIVKLIFQTFADSSGIDKLVKGGTEAQRTLNQLSGAARTMGHVFGPLGGIVGGALGAFVQGNIWQVAALGVNFVVEKLGLFKDKSEETKKKLDDLNESSRRFYATIKENSSKVLDKIDAETKRRNEQLDITNRMIKAELQLQKAKAISNGDAAEAESVDRRMAEADQATAMDKALGSERDAGARVKAAESGLSAAKKAEREANAELKKAEDALKTASKPVSSVLQSSAGAFVMTNTRDTTAEQEAVKAAKKRLELAEQTTDSAMKSLESEREKLKIARENVRVIKAEQEAANAEASAKKMADAMKAEKERVAAEQKAVNDLAESDRKLEEKKAKDKIDRDKKDLVEYVRRRNEARKAELQDDIEANRQRAASLEKAMGDAMDRVRETHDVIGNAAGMNQAEGVSSKRQDLLNNTRFANGAADLIGSGKITQGKDGVWRANGRLSNLNQAILDRLNAEQNKKNVGKEKDKVVDKLDELIRELKMMTTL